MERTHNKLIISICAALTLVTVVAFEPLRHNKFISSDDGCYVTDNPQVQAGITCKSVIWAFTTAHGGISYWHPLTWLSHMLDCGLFGLNPIGHHLTNLLFHIANTLLLFWVLKRMTGAFWRSAFVAAVFALHPLNVESVAWVSERKNVLSTFFWLLTIAAYIRYAEHPAIGKYLLVVFVFCLGLMAKPMVVTLPFVLLLLDYWPLKRFQWKTSSRLVWEKIPFFALLVPLSMFTFFAQRSLGAMVRGEKLSLDLRIANALVSYIAYLGKMFYPSRLAVFYPHPVDRLPLWQPLVCLLILIVVSVAVIYIGRRYLVFGWLWYLGTLVPVIGLVQVGSQAMADRYTYLPLIGIFVMVAWGAAELLAGRRFGKIILSTASIIIFAVLLLCTHRQVRFWQNDFTLYGHAVAVTKNNIKMLNNLGIAFQAEDKIEEAISCYRRALQIYPDYVPAHCNLGMILQTRGKLAEAINHYEHALRIEQDVFPLGNLAWLRATQQDPNFRDPTEAVQLALRACEKTSYNDPELLDTLAAAYASAGDFPKAIETAEKAIKLVDAAGRKDYSREIQARLQLYKAGKPYREK